MNQKGKKGKSMKKYVLAINPGSTSTKVAVFEEKQNIVQKNIDHDKEELKKFKKITDQFEYRKNIIQDWLKSENYDMADFIAVVGRGGLVKPISSGIYQVTDALVKDLELGVQGHHASNLGGIIARSIADEFNLPSYIVDPVAVDEFEEIARLSGLKELPRKSLGHALNVKATAYRVADEQGKKLEDMNMIVAHLGGGISIIPLKNSKMIDCNNANEMGPFSPERAGSLPSSDLAKLCLSGKYKDFAEFKPVIRGKGGLYSYLGTTDLREAEQMMQDDEYARLVVDAMAYQIAKEIGAMATVLKGEVDCIVLTGGMAYSEYLTEKISTSVKFIAPVIIEAGEDEMEALNEGVLRVLAGEKVKIYEEESVKH